MNASAEQQFREALARRNLPKKLEEALDIVAKVRDDLERLAQRACDHDTPEGYIDTVEVAASRLNEVEQLLKPAND